MGERHQFLADVRSNSPLCPEHFRLVLHVRTFPPTSPGTFIQIQCRDPESASVEFEIEWVPGTAIAVRDPDLLAPLALLRRPFSLAGRRDASDGVELDVIHRVVGVGTDWLSRLRNGDRVDILGPLGNCFDLPHMDETALLVGGGVGIPPMLYLAAQLAGRNAVAFCGAVSKGLLPLTLEPNGTVAEFAMHGIPTIITTDDGTLGERGLVTQALERFLDNPQPPTVNPRFIIYTCGPEPMMKRVAEIAIERDIECQVAVERAMACGMGTCQSCCIRVRKPHQSQPPLVGSDWCYRLACADGPVFRAADLLW